MNRYFISVGTSASGGMIRMIRKMQDENIFRHYPNDVYIALDSDSSSEQSNRQKVQDLKRSHGNVHSVDIEIGGDDIRDGEVIQHRWEEIRTIPAGGVGGLREVAEKARNWREKLYTLVFNELRSDDMIVLLGTAFGGTASGSYWGVAEFIAAELAKKICETSEANANGAVDSPYKNVVLLGFAILPRTARNASYHIGPNVCDFMRELQLTHWRRRLQRHFQNNDDTDWGQFKVPVYSHSGREKCFPLYCGGTEGVDDTFMPMTTLYFIPSPDSGNSSLPEALLCETVFAVCYLGVQEAFHTAAIDRFRDPRGSHKHEDKPFGGLHMIVYQSGRTKSLRAWFNNGVIKAGGGFLDDVPKPQIVPGILEAFRSFFCPRHTLAEAMKDANFKALTDAKGKVCNDGKFADFQNTLPGIAQIFTDGAKGFPANKCFKEFMAYLVAKKYTENWFPLLNANSILKAYEGFRGEFEQLRAQASTLVHEMTSISEKAASALAKRSSARQSVWLGKVREVQSEIISTFSRVFDKKADDFQHAVRCSKTQLWAQGENDRFLQELVLFCTRIKKVNESLSKDSGGENAYPHIVGGIIVPCEMPSAWKWENADSFARTVLQASLEQNDNDRDNYLNERRQSGIDKLNSLLESNDYDPFRGATVNLNPSSGSGIQPKPFGEKFSSMNREAVALNPPKWLNSFAIVTGNAVTADCQMKNAYVSDNLGFNAFTDMTPSGNRFFDAAGDAKAHLSKTEFANPQLETTLTSSIQGIWLGTHNSGLSFREILKVVESRWQDWELESTKLNDGAKWPRRIFTLREMVFTGAVMHAVETALRRAWVTALPHNITFTVRFKREDADVSFGPFPALDTGLTLAEQPKPRLSSISGVFLRQLLNWIRDKNTSGFGRMFRTEISTIAPSLDEIDSYVLTKGRLSLTEAELNGITTLMAATRESCHAEFTSI
ncbi:MAG: hypothetical protein FWG50_03465 [Kiritimatiellaeota bacterium]|nr:hypothetical protein [Kiritimatiellota bacterium]